MLSHEHSVFGFTLGLWLHPRYTWALWILDYGLAQTSGHALIIIPSSLTSLLDIRALCILSYGIPHKSSQLGVGFALDTRGGRHPLLWLHPRIASSTDYQTLGSRHRYLGPSGTYGEGDSTLLPLVRKKSAMVTRKIGKHV